MQAAASKPGPFAALPRRLALLVCLAALPILAGCGGDEPAPQVFAPTDFSYLNKLRLNVASVEIDNTWTPPADSGQQHVEYLSPVQPIDALSTMARQRLVASGNSGRARFVIEDASIVQQPGSLYGSLAARLDVSTSDGQRSGFAGARVARSQPISSDGDRATAYELVKRMMDDMNVEFEFQVRRSLRDYLQTTSGSAPVPPPVEAQPLPPPPGATEAPPPSGSTLMPPQSSYPPASYPPASYPPASAPPPAVSSPPSTLAPSPSSGPIPLSPPPGFLAPSPPPAAPGY